MAADLHQQLADLQAMSQQLLATAAGHAPPSAGAASAGPETPVAAHRPGSHRKGKGKGKGRRRWDAQAGPSALFGSPLGTSPDPVPGTGLHLPSAGSALPPSLSFASSSVDAAVPPPLAPAPYPWQLPLPPPAYMAAPLNPLAGRRPWAGPKHEEAEDPLLAPEVDLPTVTAAEITAFLDAAEERQIAERGRREGPWRQELARPYYVRLSSVNLLQERQTLPYESVLEAQFGASMITITMYNEEWAELEETMAGCLRNLKEWKRNHTAAMAAQVVLVILIDGRAKMAASTRVGLEANGFVDLAQLDAPAGLDVLHCFYSCCWHVHATARYGPAQVLVCVKERNGGKLDSHKVFLDGLCRRVRPEYVFLLDCGTIPRKDALYRLFAAMEHNEEIGGCAGEIEAQRHWCNPVVVGQMFEYKIAHVLDKAAESVLGFISVLPGAFSAYRFRALVEPDARSGRCPLDKYFAGLEAERLGPFMANIYLAEDRILCFELMARTGTSYSLVYVPGAVAVTDVPMSCADLLKQRKRWLNGAFFALFYCFLHAHQFYTSGLSPLRKMSITVEMLLLTVLTALNLIGPGIFYAIFQLVVVDVLTQKSRDVGLDPGLAQQCSNLLNFSLIFVLFIQVVFGLGNSQPTHIKNFYSMSLLYFALFQMVVLSFGLYFVFTSEDFFVWIAAGVLFGTYPLGALLHNPADVLVVSAALPVYLLLVPLFIIVLPIRAFANIHDISWGTKGLETTELDARAEHFQRFRSIYLLGWLSVNTVVAAVVLQVRSVAPTFAAEFLRALFWLAGSINAFRLICLFILKMQGWVCTGAAIRRAMEDAPTLEDVVVPAQPVGEVEGPGAGLPPPGPGPALRGSPGAAAIAIPRAVHFDCPATLRYRPVGSDAEQEGPLLPSPAPP